MKLSKKKVFTLALAVCLIAILSLGSLAWFTYEDSVTNDFYFGTTEDEDPEGVFGLDVLENRDTNGDGDYNEIGDAEADTDGLEYFEILPGQVLSKEPYLKNTGIHPQFVRAIVTVSDAYILREAMMGAWGDVDKFLPGMGDKWVLEDILYTTDDELAYVYYYTEALEPGTETQFLFDAVVIPTELTLDQAIDMENFNVNVLGQAIQSEHLADPAAPGTMVATAQRAFELYWDAEGTIAGYADEDILANAKANGTADTDVYVSVVDPETSEISLTNETISVSEAVVKFDASILNSTVIIDGCNLTVADGGYIVYCAEPGGQQVCISTDTTINGISAYELYKTDRAALQAYFHNIEVWTIVWFN